MAETGILSRDERTARRMCLIERSESHPRQCVVAPARAPYRADVLSPSRLIASAISRLRPATVWLIAATMAA
jgi:hypothetical protein